MPPEQQSVPSAQIVIASTAVPQAPQVTYAGFWIRLLAVMLDSVVVAVLIGLPMRIIQAVLGTTMNENSASPSFSFSIILMLLAVVQIVLNLTYFIYLTNKNQATIGKKLLGLRVVSESGARLTLRKVIMRETVGKLLSFLVLGIGYLMAGFTHKKQALHDKMVGSIVTSTPNERKTWAFVIGIILAAILPIIAGMGILTAITLASLNVAREKGADASIKANLSMVRPQAELVYDSNNNSYATICTDPTIVTGLYQAENSAKTKGVCNANKDAYAVYVPLKKPTAQNTGWCVSSTEGLRESMDIGSSTTCS